ncbi:T9SS type A sorting domain-containing protein [Chryseobacterium arthrosphaerae]|uniref:T9SS type A sorting domain-containing protein n=1 Tax=Chryseobacterium arthrosphaerae TaxID=651561 RepID=A0A432DTR2_9FLAO|nr:T9SS type A sorting domain-containing protein [Chryseobacterium arthrosphaerae]
MKSGQKLNIAIKNAKRNLKAEIYDMTGQLLTAARGSVEEINKKVNDRMQNLKTGIYIISIYDEDTSLYQSKIIKE